MFPTSDEPCPRNNKNCYFIFATDIGVTYLHFKSPLSFWRQLQIHVLNQILSALRVVDPVSSRFVRPISR